jgi:pimeloyl-ACP methyl ester carboxylesterase
MQLLVFPGAGNPEHPRYAKVYSLIEKLATKNGFLSVDVSVRWPGHFRPPTVAKGMLNLTSAAQEAVSILKRYETAGQRYAVLGRSFGTFVILRALRDVQVNLLERIVLWGPPPMWKNWDCFVRQITDYQAKSVERWVHLDPNYYAAIEPMESLLISVHVPTRLASGELDTFCSPVDLAYYRRIIQKNRCVHVVPKVKGAEHEVTEDASASVVAGYEKALFGANS